MSRTSPLRRHLLHSLSGGAVVVGVWALLVRPVERAAAERRDALAAAQREVDQWETTLAQTGDVGPAIDEMRERLDALYAWSAPSAEPGRLYESLRSLAKQSGVRIERIEPAPTRQAPRTTSREREPEAETFGYTIEVTGTYGAIALFVEACESGMGAARVSALRITAGAPTPEGREPVLSAVVETTHLRLTPPGDRAPGRASRPGLPGGRKVK